MKKEIWKDIYIQGELSNYKVSNLGRIYNKKYNRYFGSTLQSDGRYLIYNLRHNGKKVRYLAHRLIAEYFIPCERDINKMQVNHINGNKHDNTIGNLEWVTPKENIEHQFKTRLSVGKAYEKFNCYDIRGNFIKQFESIHQCSKELGINSGNIHNCLNHKVTYAKDFIFRYINDETKVNDLSHKTKHHRGNKELIELDNRGNILNEYVSISEASRLNNIHHSSITASIKENRTTKGKKFILKEDYIARSNKDIV